MTDIIKEITCPRCGYTRLVNFTDLEKERQVLFREFQETRTYSIKCPKCGTHKTVTIGIPERDDA